jgi:hypothetical protein
LTQRELATLPRTPAPTGGQPTSAYERLKQDNVKLRKDNHELAEHLELAIANIQRLSVDNHGLRQALEAARNVTRLPIQRDRH